MDNVFVRLIEMPISAKGFVALDENGDYNVYINERLSDQQRMAALAHEVLHIDREHLRVQLPFMFCEEDI